MEFWGWHEIGVKWAIKMEMPHRVGHDNVIARVREERERNARCYLAAVKRPLRGICTFHVSHLSCLSEVIA